LSTSAADWNGRGKATRSTNGCWCCANT
jgi:hypothetical protein